MPYTLPKLPYAKEALAPAISAATLEYHHDKHHATYVSNLNGLLEGTGLDHLSLEELFTTGLEQFPREKRAAVFNNAAQVWNHTFYFSGMRPGGGGAISAKLAQAIEASFGSPERMKDAFVKAAVGTFGSGWCWLVKGGKGNDLEIVSTSNAGNPIVDKRDPLLTCDVWEHAYYIDYRNARLKYVEAWWSLIDWDVVSRNFGG